MARRGRATLLAKVDSYESAAEFLGERKSAMLAHNTDVIRRDSLTVAIAHLGTEIVTFHRDGRITLNSGGWRTATTLHRINAVLPFGITVDGSTVSGWTGKAQMHERPWRVFTPEATYDFYDGITV